MVLFHHSKFVWWEYVLPTSVTLICITVAKLSIETARTSDIEYHNVKIVRVVYYEAYTTWRHKICSRTHSSGSGKHRRTWTTHYDCSYCDENSAYWEAVDENGETYRISQEKYVQVVRKWNNETKLELNRDINYHYGCGQDGDAYVSYFDNKPEHAEVASYTSSFDNKVIVAKETFHLKEIDDSTAIKNGLHFYPKTYDYYKQQSFLGFKNSGPYEDKFQYLNATLNKQKNCHFWYLAFYNKPINISYLQEHFWSGGKDNEVVVCVGLDENDNLQWVRSFSWTNNKRVNVEFREEIMELKTLDYNKLYNITNKTITSYYKKKNFHDYDYISVEPNKTEFIVCLIITLIVTFGVNYYCYHNEFEN